MSSTSEHSSFYQVARLVFVIFSLYLIQDALWRWEGTSYFATLSQFIPALALISILWTISSLLTAFCIWLSLRGLDYIGQRIKWKINLDNLLLFIAIIIALGFIFWVTKRLVFGSGSNFTMKLLISLSIIALSLLFTWIFRGKLGMVQEHITPLVWLFGIIVILSFPIILYNVLIKGEENLISQHVSKPLVDKQNRPNILLVTLDALTARDMSLYGYHRPTTPFIDKWSKNASVFTRTEAEGNYTFPTTLSLMTGKRQWTHLQYNPNGRMWLNPENMPKLLKSSGYYNMAFIQNPLASVERLGIKSEFEIAPGVGEFNRAGLLLGTVDDLLYEFVGDKILLYDWFTKRDFLFGAVMSRIANEIYVTEFPPKRVFDGVLSVLSDVPSEPYFVWVHLNPPHDPYLPPKKYMGMFNSSERLRTQKSQYEFTRTEEGPAVKVDQETLDILRARYDEFIAYNDEQFKYFIHQLETNNLLSNTVVILSSDHGESFEHDNLTHGGDLYEQVTHIPLIIKEPGQTSGRIIHDLVEQVDITATIMDLAGVSLPSWMEGRSLKPLLRGNSMHPKPIYSMSLHKNSRKIYKIKKGQVAVWRGDYKLIHDLKGNNSLLFNLKDDNSELNNLIDIEPEVGKHLIRLIDENLAKANSKLMSKKETTID